MKQTAAGYALYLAYCPTTPVLTERKKVRETGGFCVRPVCMPLHRQSQAYSRFVKKCIVILFLFLNMQRNYRGLSCIIRKYVRAGGSEVWASVSCQPQGCAVGKMYGP
jgi:hypothetical protein